MKKLIMITVALLILLIMPFTLFGCNENPEPTDAPTDAPTDEPTEKPTDAPTDKPTEARDTEIKERIIKLRGTKVFEDIKTLGRTTRLSNGLACDHTGSGIEFRGVMEGKVELKVNATSRSGNSTYFTVYIDGERQEKRSVISGTTSATLELANFAEQGYHTIKIVKQTEPKHSLSEFVELKLTGYLDARPEDKEYYIEVIGDSLTAGLGNMVGNEITAPNSTHSDGTQSYGYMLAERLGADYSIIAESGVAISVGVNGFEGHQTSDLYDKASIFRDATKKHEQTERVPNVIVINLGTNDSGFNSSYNKNWCTIEDVKRETEKLIEQVRGSYGEAGADIPVVWAGRFVGIREEYLTAIKDTLTAMGGEEAGLYYTDVTRNTDGGQWHPTIEGHETACEEIYDFIAQKRIVN